MDETLPNARHSSPSTPGATPDGRAAVPDVTLRLERALLEVKRLVVGQDQLVERLFVSLLAPGHCLLEGVPGVAKTLAARTLATVVGGTFARIQFTPDLVPADIIGTRVYRPSKEDFEVEMGPIVSNLMLADEINRAPAKVQSALLEAMAEQQVSIGGRTIVLPDPFLVLATQNPIESEGVYPLPEAQRDRFLLKVQVGLPSDAEERRILDRVGTTVPVVTPQLDAAEVAAMQRHVAGVFVHDAIADYAVRIVVATRDPGRAGVGDLAGLLAVGASPRATLGLVAAARALAVLRGREYVLPVDVRDLAVDVIAHRLVLDFEALADGVDTREVVTEIVERTPEPQVVPAQGQAQGRAQGQATGQRPGRESVA